MYCNKLTSNDIYDLVSASPLLIKNCPCGKNYQKLDKLNLINLITKIIVKWLKNLKIEKGKKLKKVLFHNNNFN